MSRVAVLSVSSKKPRALAQACLAQLDPDGARFGTPYRLMTVEDHPGEVFLFKLASAFSFTDCSVAFHCMVDNT